MKLYWAARALAQVQPLAPVMRERLRSGLERFTETGEGNVRAVMGNPGAYRLRIGPTRLLLWAVSIDPPPSAEGPEAGFVVASLRCVGDECTDDSCRS